MQEINTRHEVHNIIHDPKPLAIKLNTQLWSAVLNNLEIKSEKSTDQTCCAKSIFVAKRERQKPVNVMNIFSERHKFITNVTGPHHEIQQVSSVTRTP